MKKRTGYYAYIAIACCTGIAASATSLHWGPLLFLAFYTGLVYFIRKSIGICIAVCLSALLFCLYMNITDNFNTSKHSPLDQHFLAQIISPIAADGDKITFQIKSEKGEKLLIEYYMKKEEELQFWTSLKTGDICQLNGILKEPSPPTNPHAFNYQKFLYYQSIHWIISLSTPPAACHHPSRYTLLHSLANYRDDGIKLINHHIQQPAAGFMISLIFGDRTFIDKEIIDSYQLLGLVHLLAISGLHVGVITAAVFFIGIRIGITREFMNGTLLILLPFYVMMAGGAPSVMRAAMMTGFILFYVIVKRRFLSVDAIGLACIVMLIINPYYLFHVGFQLSFTVSFALLLSARKISSLPNKLSQLFYVSFIAQIASLPILLFHFYQVSIWSIVLNILYVPFFSLFVLPFCFVLFTILLFFPVLLPIFVPILTFPLLMMNQLAVWMAGFPFGTFVFGKPAIWMIIFYGGSILFLFGQMERKQLTKAKMTAISCFILSCLIHWNSGYLDGNGKVVTIDIGQGDAILITLPYKKEVYLIDTGGTFSFPQENWKRRKHPYNSGESVLIPFLKAEGIRRINKLILSHGDFDHIGNVSSLWGRFRVDEMYVPVGFGGDELEDEILFNAKKRKVDIFFVPGNRTGWEASAYRFYFLHPHKIYSNKNDGSIVLFAELGEVSWLFTGDLEEQGEQDLLALYPRLKADVLKAGHHGSKTSTTAAFVKQLQPKAAIISAGRNNRYGHPHEEVLDRLMEEGAIIYRTDDHGAVSYIFTNRSGTFSTVLP